MAWSVLCKVTSIVRAFLKDDTKEEVSLLRDLNNLNDNAKEQDKFAGEIIEIEANLGALETSPCASFTLMRCVPEKIMPNPWGIKPPASYEKINYYIIRLLAVEIFKQDTLDPAIWRPYLARNLKDRKAMKRFDGIIKDAAKEARKKHINY